MVVIFYHHIRMMMACYTFCPFTLVFYFISYVQFYRLPSEWMNEWNKFETIACVRICYFQKKNLLSFWCRFNIWRCCSCWVNVSLTEWLFISFIIIQRTKRKIHCYYCRWWWSTFDFLFFFDYKILVTCVCVWDTCKKSKFHLSLFIIMMIMMIVLVVVVHKKDVLSCWHFSWSLCSRVDYISGLYYDHDMWNKIEQTNRGKKSKIGTPYMCYLVCIQN